MKKFLKKKITIKKTIGSMLMESIICAFIFFCMFFITAVFFNTEAIEFFNAFVQIFRGVSKGEISAFELSMIFAPVILVLFETIRLGIIVINLDKKK